MENQVSMTLTEVQELIQSRTWDPNIPDIWSHSWSGVFTQKGLP